MEISKKDWKLFREKLAGWQENYMDKLTKEYIHGNSLFPKAVFFTGIAPCGAGISNSLAVVTFLSYILVPAQKSNFHLTYVRHRS